MNVDEFGFSNIFHQFFTGFFAFECPSEMVQWKSEIVNVELFIDNRLNKYFKKEVEQILLTKIMKLKLSGNGFIIESKSSEAQAILPHQITVWEWSVLPIKHGLSDLEFNIISAVNTDNNNIPYDLSVRKKIVMIKINRGYIKGFLE